VSDDRLARYREKRDFSRTTEPGADAVGPQEKRTADGGPHRFVVQKHAARRLHYDVRIEADGVLVSWAVPKGPSYDPAVRRLAVHVEDHPIDYRTFEGTIGTGTYGAGAVIVWDEGTYHNESAKNGDPIDVRAALEKGHVTIRLEGEKLRGGWHLIRAGGHGPPRRTDDWLMIKRRDDEADAGRDVVGDAPASVRSGLTVEQVAAGALDPPPAPAQACPATEADLEALGAEGDWLGQRRPAGNRYRAVRAGARVELWDAAGEAGAERHPDVVAAVLALPVDDLILDGVVTAAPGPGGAVYVATDVLRLLGQDTAVLATSQRAALLARLDGADRRVGVAGSSAGAPADIVAAARRAGWAAVTLKRIDAPYPEGPSPSWREVRTAE
jgi:bifunctional non-homologous end joining protein LigD